MKVPCGNRLDSNATFSDKNASSGVRFSFSLQDYVHNLYVFMEIYKIMLFFCQQVPQALCRIDERTLFTLSLQST